ncbi:cell division/cell wall cluster transcriptional repressor MraZ [Candidatus Falkowbacteria bacterium RIFOXYD2_FULL_35_9]|uniref:Transcriptional regulator MraZ n=1 Tax=Candidatus Falkowbacteria bacterium RIFOXYC2_FULL_36_12 TaxID=1798002 RepID=A0A1F5SZQ0_9BACT|nr:MAG: cell division/cell wall cluster transcriptional repressor MraZ [Candidatus Falkowbacteria bacterium RIFOXYB2_FULL_35_7]OGF31701.1 MAG: cell division/cell wall cluster transcriptional repressor MraZ [Candidatus Falkowbacteria bacterium RIFOXYC2_FULL_36_12]OGF33173.1 MAG: cell division/cell wall cluster transcriptional repressor MraZ [Candidatus Falkowbacteria bacterium RIFOXYA2_FULL_35_8]OGF46181.1 MAG: cell division/cell wall cluster transcriptional repressor MraZ [Candidatus Falkowbacte
MFIGEYKHSIDQKGRLSVPIKFQSRLKKGAVVTRGLDNSLFLYTKEEWQKLAHKLAELPMSQANTRAFARLMLAGAMDISLDKQGRFVLPDYLRKFAGISKKVVIAGLFNRLELWSEETWEKYKQATEKDANQIAEKLSELGV